MVFILYGVINIDIVGSRKVKDRAHLQSKINHYIDIINDKFTNILLAPITVTLGDEWQIVTSDPTESYNLIQEFQQLFWKDGIELYAGIGIGNLHTYIDDDVRNMDGPCFITARNALEVVKRRNSKEYVHSTKNRVFFYYQEISNESYSDRVISKENVLTAFDLYFNESINEVAATTDIDNSKNTIKMVNRLHYYKVNSNVVRCYRLKLGQLINTLIENTEVLKLKMTKKQKMLFVDYEKYKSYQKIVEAYDGTDRKTTKGSISVMLNNAEYFVIKQNQKVIKELFGYYCKIWSD